MEIVLVLIVVIIMMVPLERYRPGSRTASSATKQEPDSILHLIPTGSLNDISALKHWNRTLDAHFAFLSDESRLKSAMRILEAIEQPNKHTRTVLALRALPYDCDKFFDECSGILTNWMMPKEEKKWTMVQGANGVLQRPAGPSRDCVELCMPIQQAGYTLERALELCAKIAEVTQHIDPDMSGIHKMVCTLGSVHLELGHDRKWIVPTD